MYLYAEKYESKYRDKTLSYPKELEELLKKIMIIIFIIKLAGRGK